MVLGSTGEFLFFSPEERIGFLRRVTELVAPLPVLANISDVNPRTVASLARTAREAGCAAVAVLPPWYFATAQADLLEFFLRAAEAAAPLPVFLYNFPERVGTAIALETMAAFADRMPLAGVKLSGGAWDLHQEVLALARQKKFCVLTGWDTRLAEAMAFGCAGCISGLANFVPELVVGTFMAMMAGSSAKAREFTEGLRLVTGELSGLGFPHDVTAGMAARGFEVGVPKQALSASTRAARDAAAETLRRRFQQRGWA